MTSANPQPSTSATRTRPAPLSNVATLLACLSPAALAVVLFFPALSAGYIGDDWAILTLARHSGSPFAYFLADHSATYSYRPNGVLVWHLVTVFFGDAAWPQYLVQVGLHAINAALLTLLLLRLRANRWIALLLGVIYALHPVGFGTVLWLSARYDLLTVGGVLALLLSMDKWLLRERGSLLLIVFSAAWAAGSKETALAVVPAVFGWILFCRRKGKLTAISAALLPFLLALLARWWIFGSSGLDRTETGVGLVESLMEGVLLWLDLLPTVVFDTSLPRLLSLFVMLIAGAILSIAFWRQLRTADEHHTRQRALIAGASLLLMPALLQAPITSYMLSLPSPLSNTTNLRFYYMALAGLTICLGQIPMPRLGPIRITIGAGLLLASITWAVAGWSAASHWQEMTAKPERLKVIKAVGQSLAAQPYEPGCVLYIENLPDSVGDLHAFLDPIAKSQQRTSAASLDCLVLSEKPSAMSITGSHRTTKNLPEGVPIRYARGQVLEARSVLSGRLWMSFPGVLSPEEARARPGTTILRWDEVQSKLVRVTGASTSAGTN